jgi:hypothetical protein
LIILIILGEECKLNSYYECLFSSRDTGPNRSIFCAGAEKVGAGGVVWVTAAAAIVIIIRNCDVFIINMAEELGTGEELKSRIKTRVCRYTDHFSSHVAHPVHIATVSSNTPGHAIGR